MMIPGGNGVHLEWARVMGAAAVRSGKQVSRMLAAAVFSWATPNIAFTAHAGPCSRDDFATVVEQASDSLRLLNADNTPKFQSKLRTLKDRRKWTHDQFMKEAAPFVQDETIQGLDEKTATLLNKIQGLGDGGGGKEPDCALLAVLQDHMQALVETTRTKWSYMNSKIDTALAAIN
jgi:hypothetical protein